MSNHRLELSILVDHFAICRLDAGSEIPAWAISPSFLSLTHTTDEVSIVCPQEIVPSEVQCHRGWRCIKVSGPLELGEIGILESLIAPLAQEEISVFAISTFETDYLLVQERYLAKTSEVLRRGGHRIEPGC